MSISVESLAVLAHEYIHSNNEEARMQLHDVFLDLGLEVPKETSKLYFFLADNINDTFYHNYLMDNLPPHATFVEFYSSRDRDTYKRGLLRTNSHNNIIILLGNTEHELCYDLYLTLNDFYPLPSHYNDNINQWFSNRLSELNVRELYILKNDFWLYNG